MPQLNPVEVSAVSPVQTVRDVPGPYPPSPPPTPQKQCNEPKAEQSRGTQVTPEGIDNPLRGMRPHTQTLISGTLKPAVIIAATMREGFA